jgi:hypothetical protein
MQNIIKNRAIIIVGLIFLVIIIITIFLIIQFGKVYKGGLESISTNNQNEIQMTKKKPIKKIILKNVNDTGCVEVTSEGIVRVYDECDKDLKQAARLTDSKNILKLIKLVSETDWEKYIHKGLGNFYEIVIETENGIQTIYIPIDDSNGVVDEIIKTVDEVKNDIPGQSPIPSINLSSILPNVSSDPIVLPSGWEEFGSPQPSSDTIVQQPFVCPFIEQGGKKKPVNVSNIICSADPSQAP